MNLALFAHTWRANRTRVLIVAVALAIWGTLLPIIYDSFGSTFKDILDSGAFPPQFAQFGGGDIFSLPGSVAIGFIHPIAVGVNLVIAVGFATAAIAGERQRGTLEVLLSRPISRGVLYATLAVSGALFVGIATFGSIMGSLIGASLTGRTAELGVGQLPLLWLNGALLYWAIGSIALFASASSDRLSQALAPTLAFVVISYFLDVLGSLWPDAKGLQPYSIFYYLDPKAILAGLPVARDLVVLSAVTVVAVVAALLVFPRRDLAAPS
jgi:ABC-2 type transport system permease protein